MIEAVLMFAAITALGEWLILSYMHPRVRLMVLSFPLLLHTSFAALNLWIHWGTMTGSMTAVTAFVVSVYVCKAAKWRFA